MHCTGVMRMQGLFAFEEEFSAEVDDEDVPVTKASKSRQARQAWRLEGIAVGNITRPAGNEHVAGGRGPRRAAQGDGRV